MNDRNNIHKRIDQMQINEDAVYEQVGERLAIEHSSGNSFESPRRLTYLDDCASLDYLYVEIFELMFFLKSP